ncbi:hypothetical protein AZE42_14112, partial [Rhizopogon vesiculosus]
MWGHGFEVLQNRANLPRPAVPVPAPTGPSMEIHDREVAIRNHDEARAAPPAGSSTMGAGAGESVESGAQMRWDEDDVM